LTKAGLYVYFGPVAVLVCRRFDHIPFMLTRQFADKTTRGLVNSPTARFY